jgi:hypothetical protein
MCLNLVCVLFCTVGYGHSDFGNFSREFQIIIFVQESLDCVIVQLDTLP